MRAENKQLTVRPAPKPGESLTSFLIRAGILNGCDAKDIWRNIHTGSIHMLRSSLFYRLDYDYELIDPKKLSQLLDISIDTINQLTFFMVCSKFFEDPYQDYDRALVMIQSALNKQSCKYCPICLEYENVYKLIWQVKSINICFIHHVTLKSIEERIDNDPEKMSDAPDIDQQEETHKRWQFLMLPSKTLAKRTGKLNMEKSLALKLLYVAQNQATVYVRKDIKGFSKNIVKSIVAFVRGTSTVKKVTQSLLFDVLDYANMSIEQFARLGVPKSYLNSLLTVNEKQIQEQLDCLTSWCNSRERQGMVLVNERVEPRKKGIRYPYYYVCEYCYMRYSYYPTDNKWTEIDGNIDMILSIRKHAIAGMTRAEVSRKLKINFFRVSEIYGYLAYQQLLPEEVSDQYKYANVPENLVSLFECLQCDSHTFLQFKYSKARDRFGWNLRMFSYYYAHSEVQRYFIHKRSDLKKPLKKHRDLPIRFEECINQLMLSEVRLSLTQVATALECSEKTLHSYEIASAVQKAKDKQLSLMRQHEEKKLRKTFDDLLSGLNKGNSIKMKTVYECLGKDRGYILDNYPGLVNYITDLVKIVNEKAKRYRLEQVNNQIRTSVQLLIKQQRKLSFAAVARQLGIQAIHAKAYKTIKELIMEEIENDNNYRR